MQLLNSGIAPRQVRRIITELHDHIDDIQLERTGQTLSVEEIKQRLGDPAVLTEHILAQPELRTWTYRYPRIAQFTMPVAYVLLLPTAPFFAGIANAALVARWGASLLLGAAVTAAMLLMMQLSITLT
ncbi:MAG: hypothetical protein ACI88G_000161 [Woeseiaceae bacterium]|jgi:hypothetical protein